jgi:GWxTD domain-containing protein
MASFTRWGSRAATSVLLALLLALTFSGPLPAKSGRPLRPSEREVLFLTLSVSSPSYSVIHGAGRPANVVERLQQHPAFRTTYERSVETILSDEEREEYAALDRDARERWRRRFWTANDPTPATRRNEFLEEHLSRLEECVRLYAVTDTTWDDRGAILLRYGRPSSRTPIPADFMSGFGTRGLKPPEEMWFYGPEGMSFSFIDRNLDGHYDLGEDTRQITAHAGPQALPDGPVDPRVTQDLGPPRNIEAEHASHLFGRTVEKRERVLMEVPVAYTHRVAGPPIPVYYEVVLARGDEATDLAVNYQIPVRDLAGDVDEEAGTVSLEKRLRLLTEEHDVVAFEERTLLVVPNEATDDDPFVTDEWRMNVPPGTYIVELAVEDPLAGRAGHGRSRVEVPPWPNGSLSLSDIVVGCGASPGPRFERPGGSVVPRPCRAFRSGEELVVYVEVYGLAPGRADVGDYLVTLEIDEQGAAEERGWFRRIVDGLFGRKRGGLVTTVPARGPAPDTPHRFSVGLGNLKEGNYDLTVTVQDRSSGESATRAATFTVLDEESWNEVFGLTE